MAEKQFTIRRKILTLFGAKFHIYDEEGKLLGFCSQKAFKLKEDIRIYTDETREDERLRIAARAIIDFSAAYDVVDSRTENKVGALQRKGMKSLLRDHWTVLDPDDIEIGSIQEDSSALAFIRRLTGWGAIIPQKFHLRTGNGVELAEFRTHFNPFVHKLTVTVYPDSPISPLLILAAGVLLAAIEGRQD